MNYCKFTLQWSHFKAPLLRSFSLVVYKEDFLNSWSCPVDPYFDFNSCRSDFILLLSLLYTRGSPLMTFALHPPIRQRCNFVRTSFKIKLSLCNPSNYSALLWTWGTITTGGTENRTMLPLSKCKKTNWKFSLFVVKIDA